MSVTGPLHVLCTHFCYASNMACIHGTFAGAIVRNMREIGFENVYNRCEDFYKTIRGEISAFRAVSPFVLLCMQRRVE
jgi:hypothetical protein